MTQMAITINGTENHNLFPAFIMANSALAWDCEVILFFQPSAAPALRPGVLEGMKSKGHTDMATLLEDFIELEGKLLLCELALENQDMKPEDIREDVEVVNAPGFVSRTLEANLTYSF